MSDTLDKKPEENSQQQAISPTSPKKQKRGSAVKLGWIVLTLILMIFIILSGYSSYQAWRMNTVLTDSIEDLRGQLAQQQSDIISAQDATGAMQQSVKSLSDTVSQQGQVFQEWRLQHSQEGWRVSEARYLVNIANDQWQFTHNISLTIALLQSASQIIQQINDVNLSPIVKALAVDLVALRQVPIVDISALYLRLSQFNKLIDGMPVMVTMTSATQPSPSTMVAQSAMPWWRRGMMNAWQSLQQVVKVKYTPGNALPFIMPEQQHYLYENLHAQVDNAMWAILHYEDNIYQASLEQAETWIKQYFVQGAGNTQAVLTELVALKETRLQSPTLTLTAMPAFQEYFAREQ